jgi:hypothetical protein
MKCPTGKRRYQTVEDAETQLKIIQFWDWAWRKENRVYICDRCGDYHLSSKPVKIQENEPAQD